MRIFGFEIHRRKLEKELKVSLPGDDDKTKKIPPSISVNYHLGVLYAKLDALEKLYDQIRRDVQASERAAYRRPAANADILDLLKQKQATNTPVYKTGDPFENNDNGKVG